MDTTIERLTVELAVARAQIATLTTTVAEQAKTIAELTGAAPGAAPSIACVYWLYAPTRWGDRSWTKVYNRLTPFLRDHGRLGAHEVTPLVWDAHRAKRLQTPTHLGRPPAERTLNFSLIEVKAMLKWAVQRNMIKRNPLDAARLVKVKSRRETKVPPVELDRLLLVAGDLRNECLLLEDDDGQMAAKLTAFVLCCFDSMLRHGEAANLRWERVSETGLVELLGSETKSGRPRTVILTPRTLEAIGRVRRIEGSPFIFARPKTGQPYHQHTLRRWFQRTCERAGLGYVAAPGEGRVHIHDLRASGATAADLAGARPLAIKTALGHTSLKTTEVYLRADEITNAREIAATMIAVASALDTRGRRRRPPRKSLPGMEAA